MKLVFQPERFEKLTKMELGLYGAQIAKDGNLPEDFVIYFKANANRWDGQHLEVALSLLCKVDSTEAKHLIADYLNYPLKFICLTVLGMLQNLDPIDDYIVARIDEKLQSDEFEFGRKTLEQIRERATK
jgi:hypothetical protein